jgi:hypothetical protein
MKPRRASCEQMPVLDFDEQCHTRWRDVQSSTSVIRCSTGKEGKAFSPLLVDGTDLARSLDKKEATGGSFTDDAC